MTLRLWSTPPVWGAPSSSPFVIKLETWLRMTDVPYERATLAGPPQSKSGKIPYVTFEDGTLLEDSGHIIRHLSAKHAVDLDSHLTKEQRAVAVSLTRTLEEHLYFAGIRERWEDPRGFDIVRNTLFAHLNYPLRMALSHFYRNRMRSYTHGQGIGRMAEDVLERRVEEDVACVATFIGEGPFVFDEPTTTDATVLGLVWSAVSSPYPSRAKSLFESHDNVMAHYDLMRDTYWSNWP